MKFSLEHLFPCNVDEIWALVHSDRYISAIDGAAGLTRVLLDDQVVRDERVQRIQFIPDRTLPAAAQRAMGMEKLIYVQVQRWRERDHTMRWTVELTGLESKFSSRGDLAFQQRAKGQCIRFVNGDVRVNVPLIGGRIEKKIVEDVTSSYERAAVVTRDLLG